MGDKIIKTVLGISLLLWPAAVAAQPDTLHLEAVTVTTALRQGELPQAVRMVTLLPDTLLQAMPVTSLQEALLTVPGADIRQRGPQGVQADLSIRGGTFDQVLVMVDGIPVSDPQSGHHNLNIPVPLTSIAAVEVLKGGASALLGPDAFSGAVNIITRLPERDLFETDISYGQHGYYNAGFSGGIRKGRFSGMADIHHSASAGYRDNTDFAITHTFLRARYGNEHTYLTCWGDGCRKALAPTASTHLPSRSSMRSSAPDWEPCVSLPEGRCNTGSLSTGAAEGTFLPFSAMMPRHGMQDPIITVPTPPGRTCN